jgi:hypothetical protein
MIIYESSVLYRREKNKSFILPYLKMNHFNVRHSKTNLVPRSHYVANSLVDSFWKSNIDPNVIYGIRLYNETPLTNFDYPYQLLITTYEPTYGFYANTIQDRGGIATNGMISYQYDTQTGWRGKLRDYNTIEWEGTLPNRYAKNPGYSVLGYLNTKPVWTRVEPPVNTQSDQYSSLNILEQASQLTNRTWGQQELAYPAEYKNIQL